VRAAISATANTQMNTQTTILILLAGGCLTRIERDFHRVNLPVRCMQRPEANPESDKMALWALAYRE
jgi:hypothetical protein